MNFYRICLLVLVIGTSIACNKEDKSTEPDASPSIKATIDNFRPEAAIYERNALWGRDVRTGKTYEYNIGSQSVTEMNFLLPQGAYYAQSDAMVVAAVKDPVLQRVYIKNLLDGSTLKTIDYNFGVTAAALSDGKLFIIESNVSYNRLHVYDYQSEIELDSEYIGFTASHIAVSQDGKKIYTAKQNTQPGIYSFNWLSNNTLEDDLVEKNAGLFIFSTGNYCLTTNGKKILANTGILYDETISQLADFGGDDDTYYLSPDGKYALTQPSVYSNRVILYDGTTYLKIKEADLDEENYLSKVPYYHNGKLYMAMAYSSNNSTTTDLYLISN